MRVKGGRTDLSLTAQSNCSGWLDATTSMNRLLCSPVLKRKALRAARVSSLMPCLERFCRKASASSMNTISLNRGRVRQTEWAYTGTLLRDMYHNALLPSNKKDWPLSAALCPVKNLMDGRHSVPPKGSDISTRQNSIIQSRVLSQRLRKQGLT